MQLFVIHKTKNSATNNAEGVLRFAVSSEPVAGIVFDGLSRSLCLGRSRGPSEVVCAVPKEWCVGPQVTAAEIIAYTEDVPICLELLRKAKRSPWFVVSNGRFAAQINGELLNRVLGNADADVVTVSVKPRLLAYYERVRLTDKGKLAGFRRLYSDFAKPAPIPIDWPHHILVGSGVLDRLLVDGTLPNSFSTFLQSCRSNSLRVQSVYVGGTRLDLDTEEGLLSLFATRLKNNPNTNSKFRKRILDSDSIRISPGARISGNVLFGQDVTIGENAIIVGPTVISSNAKVEKGAVIRASIVGPGVSVARNCLIQNRVLVASRPSQKQAGRTKMRHIGATSINGLAAYESFCPNSFQTWPRFSYAGSFKRIADIVAAMAVLILFAPILPMIALAIKLTSRGPVFFKDERQALHGRAFKCLKFRTMVAGAGKIQERLKVLNEADGPQFKMVDDPRLTAVGRFLRDTYIDEIPQFFNVLLGQMSVVGPRPSPESENTMCPYWRDARLSVRPGITGLWQVCRTRQPMKDFQEWIYYDTEYVRGLSLKMDLWICWRTAKKMASNFVSRF